MSAVDEYVESIRVSCTSSRTFTVILKPGKVGEVFDRVMAKGRVVLNLGGAMVRVRFGDVKVTLFRNGRMVLQGIEEREVKGFLSRILA